MQPREVRALKNTFDEHENVASATECTGLMAMMPRNMTEDENQAELYSIHSAAGKEMKCRKRAKKRR